jgi:hypothetical protein
MVFRQGGFFGEQLRLPGMLLGLPDREEGVRVRPAMVAHGDGNREATTRFTVDEKCGRWEGASDKRQGPLYRSARATRGCPVGLGDAWRR